MSLKPNRHIIIVGAGPFMSRSLSHYLASQNWRIILISRTEEKLQVYAAETAKLYPTAPPILTRTADASDPSSILPALDWAASQLNGKVDVLCYNAAVVRPTDLMSLTPEVLTADFKIAAVGLLVAGQWFPKYANKDNIPAGEYPLLLVPGGVLDKNPMPSYSSLSATKSASQNLVDQFSQVLPKEHGILVGQPLVVQPIIPTQEGGWLTKSDPDVIVKEVFQPFFEAREAIQVNGDEIVGWIRDRVW
ncbi:hypothetical protein V493_03257 [Pseudogymnoascus sp. VKM F-4281 (FW-2241)]|nr:hypothetical protein V493_03257 [Pseudogymnoascus sp. VKM F-4281 (FW-2241)]